MGLPRLDTPSRLWLFFAWLFQSFEQSAPHPFVELTARNADFPFLVLLFLLPLALNLDHLRANRVVLPFEVILKHLVAPLLLLLPAQLHLGPLPLRMLARLLVHCVSEVAGRFEKERLLVRLVVIVGQG